MTTLADSIVSPNLDVFFDAGALADGVSGVCTQNLVDQWCLAALSAQSQLDLHGVGHVELSVQLIDRQAMQALNLQYRRQDSPTNVLSFDSGLPVMGLGDDAGGGGLLALGDLVLCPEVVMNEALQQSKPEIEHWAHLLVHGTLHLCGYDHEESQHAEAMERLEIQILSTAGIADPYGTR